MNDRLRLAELLAVRLCHDLSGPLGTLMGSLEMVNEEPDAHEEALSLATEVATGLARRIRLLRAAWGGPAPSLRVADLQALSEGLPQGKRVTVRLDDLVQSGEFRPNAARSMLNVLMLAAECLPAGGAVAVAGDPADAVVVSLIGSRAAWPAGLAGWMADEGQAWAAIGDQGSEASRGLQGPLTALIARAAGMRLGFLMAGKREGAPPIILSPAP